MDIPFPHLIFIAEPRQPIVVVVIVVVFIADLIDAYNTQKMLWCNPIDSCPSEAGQTIVHPHFVLGLRQALAAPHDAFYDPVVEDAVPVFGNGLVDAQL